MKWTSFSVAVLFVCAGVSEAFASHGCAAPSAPSCCAPAPSYGASAPGCCHRVKCKKVRTKCCKQRCHRDRCNTGCGLSGLFKKCGLGCGSGCGSTCAPAHNGCAPASCAAPMAVAACAPAAIDPNCAAPAGACGNNGLVNGLGNGCAPAVAATCAAPAAVGCAPMAVACAPAQTAAACAPSAGAIGPIAGPHCAAPVDPSCCAPRGASACN